MMKRILAGVGLSAALLVTGNAHAIIIDTFDFIAGPTDDTVFGAPMPPQSVNFSVPVGPIEEALFGPIGGHRTLNVVEGSALTNVSVSGGVFGFTAGTNPSANGGFIGQVVWEGDGSGLGGVDLTAANPFLVFTVDVGLVDDSEGPISLTVILEDVSGATSSVFTPMITTGQKIESDLSDFVGVTVEEIDRITLQLEGSRFADATVIEIVSAGGPDPGDLPVPAAVLTLGLGLVALGYFARRH